MWTRLLCIMIFVMAVPGVQGEMPLAYVGAMNNAGQNDILTVKNYDSGASMTEAYTDVEHLVSNTQVRTGSSATNSPADGRPDRRLPGLRLGRRPRGQHQFQCHRQGPHRLAVC